MTAEVAASLKDWSTSEGSNEPIGTRNVGPNTDDNLRMIQAVVRSLASRDSIASAATTDLGTMASAFLTVTGTTGITSFGTVSAGIWKVVVFEGALTLTYNATSMILPGNTNITTAAGDIGWFISEGSGNWRCLMYQRRSGQPLIFSYTVPDGAVGAPGVRFASDTDNGIYRIGTNDWGLSVAATLALELTASALQFYLPFKTTNPASTTAPSVEVSYTDTTDRESGFKFTNTGNGGPFNASGTANGAFHSRLKSLAATDLNAHFIAEHLDAGQSQQNFISFYSNVTSSADLEFEVTTLGSVSSDGGSSMTTPADYAEMFEWADGNPSGEDRVGMSVALVGDRIRIATGADEPIGVVSAMPAVLADSGELRWNGKYVRDEFGRFVLNEQGERVMNPAFDPSVPYIPRTQRQEWAPVGLVGKLRVRKGQQIGDRWVLMRNINADIDEYLVR